MQRSCVCLSIISQHYCLAKNVDCARGKFLFFAGMFGTILGSTQCAVSLGTCLVLCSPFTAMAWHKVVSSNNHCSNHIHETNVCETDDNSNSQPSQRLFAHCFAYAERNRRRPLPVYALYLLWPLSANGAK